MIADSVRTDAYIRAMRQTIKPGSVVIDLGCGPGLFALVAVQLGARRVYAIEPNDAIQIGREAARENKCSDRIEFIQELSTNVTLPEKADVIVADLHGVLPWFGQHLPSIIDARERLLAPGGVLIPRCDTAWVAIVEAPEQYDTFVKPWNGNNGVKLDCVRKVAVNMWSKARVGAENMLSEAVFFYELDFSKITGPNFDVRIEAPVSRKGTSHGFALWFDADLIEGVEFSNAPGGEELIYGNAFFPFTEPVQVDAGDRFEIRVNAHLLGEDYIWRWDTTLAAKNVSLKQSTLAGTPLSPSKLRKRANTHVPKTTEEGAITQFVLSRMDGVNSIASIATEVAKQFPLRFADGNEAFDVVGEISEKYSA